MSSIQSNSPTSIVAKATESEVYAMLNPEPYEEPQGPRTMSDAEFKEQLVYCTLSPLAERIQKAFAAISKSESRCDGKIQWSQEWTQETIGDTSNWSRHKGTLGLMLMHVVPDKSHGSAFNNFKISVQMCSPFQVETKTIFSNGDKIVDVRRVNELSSLRPSDADPVKILCKQIWEIASKMTIAV